MILQVQYVIGIKIIRNTIYCYFISCEKQKLIIKWRVNMCKT